MKILLDHCVPKSYGRMLVDHDVSTTRQMGWEQESNGKLLARAAAAFDVFLTVDRNIQFQQSERSLPVPIILVLAHKNTPQALAPSIPGVLSLLRAPLSRAVHVVEASSA